MCVDQVMMTSSNWNIFHVTGPLWGEFTGDRWIPAQRPVTRSFDVFFDLRLNERLSKQWRGWQFETPSRPLLRHCNVFLKVINNNTAQRLGWILQRDKNTTIPINDALSMTHPLIYCCKKVVWFRIVLHQYFRWPLRYGWRYNAL